MKHIIVLVMMFGILVSIYGETKESEDYLEGVSYVTPEMIADMTIVLDNGETIALLEHYDSVKSKGIPVLEESMYRKRHKVLNFEDFEIIFDLDLRVRNIYLPPGSPVKLLNGMHIGQSIDEITKRYENNPRTYIIKTKRSSVLSVNYLNKRTPLYDPYIWAVYSDDEKVKRMGLGFNWSD